MDVEPRADSPGTVVEDINLVIVEKFTVEVAVNEDAAEGTFLLVVAKKVD